MTVIVTDATSCFAKEDANQKNIIVLPMYFTENGQVFAEKYIDENKNAVGSHNIQRMKTASTSVDDYYLAFSALVENGYDVICITISSRLSSAFSNANTAKKILGKGHIEVVDSKLTGGALHFLVSEAVQLARAYPFEEILRQLPHLAEKIGVVFSVDDMDVLRRSGRIGIVSSSINTILNIRPILLCKDGTVVFGGTSRGTNLRMQKILQLIPSNAKEIIVHAKTDNAFGDMLFAKLKSQSKNVKMLDYGNVLTTHLGHNAVGVAWLTE